MGYLDGTSVTVDAVLTKKGREILSRGGQLNISSFTLSDTGVDYTLWNPDHPSGSAYYGEAIENLPMLEASVHAEYSLRNRLITLNQDTIAIPALELSAPALGSDNSLTFVDSDYPAGKVVTVTLKGFSTANVGELYFVIQDPTLFNTNARQRNKLSGTTRTFLREQDIPNATEYTITNRTANGDYNFTLTPIVQDATGRQTNIYVVHPGTGAYNELRVINDVTKLQRQTLSSAQIKG